MPDAAPTISTPREVQDSFASIYFEAFARPGHAMSRLLRARHPLRMGAASLGIAAATYVLVYFFLSQSGGRPTVFRPWLAIPAEEYYRYNLWLHVPSVLLAWISATGLTQLCATGLSGRGSFEATLATLGLGIGVATWATGLHDLVSSCLGFLGVIDQRAYEDAMSTPGTGAHQLIWSLMLVYLAALLILFTKAIQAAHSLARGRAFIAAFCGFLIYQSVFVLFNR